MHQACQVPLEFLDLVVLLEALDQLVHVELQDCMEIQVNFEEITRNYCNSQLC